MNNDKQKKWDCLWINANIATMDSAVRHAYGAVKQGVIAVDHGKIEWVGSQQEFEAQGYSLPMASRVIDANHRWLTPGLIDCHTHLIYGGNRADEFEKRLQGVSYEQISREGGGIQSTVNATRASSEEELLNTAGKRLQCLLEEGVTGVEIKSGYGLDLETEMRMLRVARQLEKNFPVKVATTFLGAHAVPKDAESADHYLKQVCEVMLPRVASENLADAVDIFCESIGFNYDQTKKLFEAAKKNNLPVKAHVDQLSNLGGASLAANYNALSVDHLEYLDQGSIDELKQSGTVAVLLPGAFYFLRETQLPPVEQLRRADVPIAIATDSNPGSSPALSLLLMLNMACTFFKLTPEEALAGVTRNAALALGWQGYGQIKLGFEADIVEWDIESPAQLAYGFGHNPSVRIMKAGKLICERDETRRIGGLS